MRLDGKVIAVTGAARGIGRSIATALIEGGAQVAISDIDEATLKITADELRVGTFGKLDVTDPGAFAAFLAKVESDLGPLGGLVNNAGIMPSGPLTDEDDKVTRRTLEINVLGVINGTKKALALMVPRGHGHIVNVASTMGEAAVPGLATYNASKAASIMFTDAARLEYRKAGVRISAVLPGGVNTDLVAGMDASISIPVPGTTRSIPIVKHVEPEDVAAAVVETIASGKSHARVYVPRSFGAILQVQRIIPRAANEALLRAMGADHKGIAQDPAKRAEYVERVGRS